MHTRSMLMRTVYGKPAGMIHVVLGALVMVSAVTALTFYKGWRRTRNTKQWLSVFGTVVRTDIREIPGKAPLFEPIVTFSYSVGGNDYESQHFYLESNPIVSKRAFAEKILFSCFCS